ncbi:MAG: hypothetical protein CSA97_04640 [Bacteroidetes bacterium]|nr:MAG: hypothetical protein CSA97_04640 [Bacteroidota bacterium]
MKYLENRDSGLFCEVEADLADYVVIQGAIGTLGRAKRGKCYNLQDTDELVEEYCSRGFRVVAHPPPLSLPMVARELLPGAPLSPEELARFRPDALEELSEQRQFLWNGEMRRFLRRVFGGRRRCYNRVHHPRALAYEFETIAAWDSPSMEKEVSRDERGMVTHIGYRLNGQLVLMLVNSWQEGFIYPFFLELSSDGLGFSRRKHLLEEARELLIGFPSFCADYLQRIAEDERQELKLGKLKKVASVAFEPLVLGSLKSKGYDFRVEERRRGYVLRVQLAPITYVQLSLPYEGVVRSAGHVMDTIQMVKGMFYAAWVIMEVVPTPARMKWGVVRRRSSLYPAYYRSNPHWVMAMCGYVDRMLPREHHHAGLIEDYMAMMRRWCPRGIRFEKRAIKGAKHWVATGTTFEGDVLVSIRGHARGFDLYLTGFDGVINFNLETGLPSEEHMCAFIMGIPGFFGEVQASLDRQLGAAIFERRVLHWLHGLRGIRWCLEVRSGGEVRVFLEMPRGKMLKVYLFYDDYEETLAELTETIGRVDRAISIGRIPFSLRRRDWMEE